MENIFYLYDFYIKLYLTWFSDPKKKEKKEKTDPA